MLPLPFADLAAAYRSGRARPRAVIEAAFDRIGADPQRAWVALRREAALAEAEALEGRDPASLPLYGVPFAVKDNLDVEGLETTAGCPAFAYRPERDAHVVARLKAAGAIALGKTHLDQFATGLNGTRALDGPCRNAFDPERIAGGSSSGSAVATALGQVGFALGTDTAGSGRVPAALNQLVGLKPTRGLLSTRGVVPACRSLDCVSIFAGTAEDAAAVFAVALGFDAEDPGSRPAQPHGYGFAHGFRLGVPDFASLDLDGDPAQLALFAAAVDRLVALGGAVVPVDLGPFLEAARLLYGSALVAERTHAVGHLLDTAPSSLHPVVRSILEGGRGYRATDHIEAGQRLAALTAATAPVWGAIDVLLTPTVPCHPTIAALEADPIALNSRLGTYTNFVNLLDLAAVAVPAGLKPSGLPFGVTLVAPAHQDVPLLSLAARFQTATGGRIGATDLAVPARQTIARAVPDGRFQVAVCGAHLAGLPLNRQLLERDGRLVEATRTAALYRLYALPGGPPFRPGLVRVGPGEAGAAIEVEVWDIAGEGVASFLDGIPAPLGLGRVALADGRTVAGFLCEGAGLEGAADISALGGWRRYLTERSAR